MPNSPDLSKNHNRLLFVDALRGFALIGILLANLVSFMGFYSLSFEQVQMLDNAQRSILFIIDWLVESKFYAIFSILFGFSFVLFQRKYQASEFRNYWIRRVLSLFLIGIIHMYFIWHGDILTLYSIIGLSLLLFYRLEDNALKIFITLLLVLPFTIHGIYTLTNDASFWGVLQDASNQVKSNYNLENYSSLELRTSNNSFHVFMANILSAIPRGMSYIVTGRISMVLAYFLIGILVARRYLSLLEDKQERPTISMKLIMLFLIPGLMLSAYYAYIKFITGSPFSVGIQGALQNIAQLIGALLLAIAYILLLFQMYDSNRFQRLFRFLSTLGQMALTNYLTQTAFCVFLFYGYGLALMGKLGYSILPVIAAMIIILQYFFSRKWLQHHKSGPLELAWKRIYNKRVRTS